MIKPKVVQGRTLNGKEFVSFLGQVILLWKFITYIEYLNVSLQNIQNYSLCFRYLRLWIKLKFRQWDHLLKFSIRPLLNVAWSCIMKEWAEQVCQYQRINFSSFMTWQKMKLEASSTSSISVNIMLLNPSPRSMKRLKRLPDILFTILSVHNKSCSALCPSHEVSIPC